MRDKKFVVIVAGIGDALCSDSSRKKIRNNNELVEKVKSTLEFLTKDQTNYSIVNFHYPSDTLKDVNVFKDYPDTKVVDMKIHE